MNKERFYHWLGAMDMIIEDKNGRVIKKIDGLKEVKKQLEKDGDLKSDEDINNKEMEENG